jgi:hypothetical protein
MSDFIANYLRLLLSLSVATDRAFCVGIVCK